MEEYFKEFASYISLGLEGITVMVIAVGALDATQQLIRSAVSRESGFGDRKEIWRRFGLWLVLGLEFALAADIVRTAIAPTWTDIGQLAAIATIRTFLNYFLEKDIEKASEIKQKEGSLGQKV
jgi:uncharacterized membrane protein